MKMKKTMRLILAVILTLGYISIALPGTKAEAASINKLMSESIYFAGKYSGKMKSGGNGGGATLSMNQYSSYDSGKEVGNFDFRAWSGRVRPKGTLTRIDKNKYRCENFCVKGTTLTFTVKKGEVIVKQKGSKLGFSKYGIVLNFSGTYKLKYHYYS